jgi:hypothetical protein
MHTPAAVRQHNARLVDMYPHNIMHVGSITVKAPSDRN